MNDKPKKKGDAFGKLKDTSVKYYNYKETGHMTYHCPKLRLNENLVEVQVGESSETKGETSARVNLIQLCNVIQMFDRS